MMLVIQDPKEYIVGRTSIMIDDTGCAYTTRVFKKDTPASVIAEMKEHDADWRLFIFPDDPEYEKYLALIE